MVANNTGAQVVTIYPEETYTSTDGNIATRAQAVGFPVRAVVQPDGPPSEAWPGGVVTPSRYHLRLIGWNGGELGPATRVVYEGRPYSFVGEPLRFTRGSRRMLRTEYLIGH